MQGMAASVEDRCAIQASGVPMAFGETLAPDLRCEVSSSDGRYQPLFYICGGVDSWRHSLLDCSVARCVWALADEAITEHLCMNEDPNPKQWLFAMMESLSRDDFARVAVVCPAEDHP
jgi:hypothetical protein